MAAKPIFTPEQQQLIQQAAVRVWKAKFKDQPSPQKKMALALGISQQSVSNLLKGNYKPGARVAEEIAILDGKNELEELTGPYGRSGEKEPKSHTMRPSSTDDVFQNLTICLQFFAASKHWSPWTVAAARAGFFGNSDFAPPEWVPKLDLLEKAMERARR